jgi:hypothetical protein
MKTKEGEVNLKKEPGFGRELYSVRESYWIFYQGMRTIRFMFKARKNRELDQKFVERLMLRVTEVMIVPCVPMLTPKGPWRVE